MSTSFKGETVEIKKQPDSKPSTPKHTCEINFDTLVASSPEAFIRELDRDCEVCGEIAEHREAMSPGLLERASSLPPKKRRK